MRLLRDKPVTSENAISFDTALEKAITSARMPGEPSSSLISQRAPTGASNPSHSIK
jgi:hypothetical protein